MPVLIGVEPPLLIGLGRVAAAFCRSTVDSTQTRQPLRSLSEGMSTRLRLLRTRERGRRDARRPLDPGDRVWTALRRFRQLVA